MARGKKKDKAKAESENREPEPIGWKAIDQALAPIYGTGEPPFHYGTVIPAFLGGQDYLQGISVYRCETPVAHWHYVTYGFTELYEKESEDSQVNGWGFELTFRLVSDTAEPPQWPLSLMQNLGRYVYRSGNVFHEGHYLDCNGKIALAEETELRALLFVRDPALAPVQSPNGAFEFLQMVGVTLDEYAQCQQWNTKRFLEIVAEKIPYYVTDLGRPSVLRDSAFRQEVEGLGEKEGSSCAHLFVSEASFDTVGDKVRVILGANAVRQLGPIFQRRLGFSRPLTIASSQGRLDFLPGDAVAWRKAEATVLEIVVPVGLARAFAETLKPNAGTHTHPSIPAMEFEIRRSEIKDAQGNVVEVIG